MQFNDQSITEESLFSLYRSQGYEDTRIALELALERITTKIATLSDTVTRKQLQDTKKLIEDEIQSSYGGLFAQMQSESLAVAMAVNAPYLLEFSTAKIPTETLDYLVNSKRDIMGYEFKELFKLTADNHARALRVTLASGVAQGMATKQIIRELNVKNESLTKHQLYSNIQTTIKDAREQTSYATYKQLEDLGVIRGYKSDAVLDSRTSEICRNLDRVTWMTTIDKVPNKPPRHFRCRTKLLPITTNEYATGKRASMDGEIADMSYGEFFATKDTQFQLKTLGRTKYDAYKKGIYKVNGIESLKPKNSLSLDEIAGEFSRNMKPAIPKIQFGYDGKFDGYVSDIRDEAKIVIDKLPKPKDITSVGNMKGALYMPNYDILLTQDNKAVFLHEYGHNIDYKLGNGKSFAMDSISKAAVADSILLDIDSIDILKELGDELVSVVKVGRRTTLSFKNDESMMLSDIVDALTKGDFQNSGLGLGHGKDYFKTLENRNTEIFANMFALWSDNKFDRAKQLFPNLTSEFEKIMKDVIDGKFD